MPDTVEIHAHLWQQNFHWFCGIIDHRTSPKTSPLQEHGYTALSLLDPNMLIHCYWIGGMPNDETRDKCQELIVSQALQFYSVLTED